MTHAPLRLVTLFGLLVVLGGGCATDNSATIQESTETRAEISADADITLDAGKTTGAETPEETVPENEEQKNEEEAEENTEPKKTGTSPSVVEIKTETKTETKVTTETPTEPESPKETTASSVQSFSITAKQWEFSPATITVKKGNTVRLTIKSIDVDHGFSLSAFSVSETLKAGETTTVEFVADKSGNFSFFCSVFCGAGHGSMKGTLVVKE